METINGSSRKKVVDVMVTGFISGGLSGLIGNQTRSIDWASVSLMAWRKSRYMFQDIGVCVVVRSSRAGFR